MSSIPTLELAQQVVAVGNSHGRKLDKFAAFGLTAKSAAHVKAPLIDECYANLECKVVGYPAGKPVLLLHPGHGQGLDRSDG